MICTCFIHEESQDEENTSHVYRTCNFSRHQVRDMVSIRAFKTTECITVVRGSGLQSERPHRIKVCISVFTDADSQSKVKMSDRVKVKQTHLRSCSFLRF